MSPRPLGEAARHERVRAGYRKVAHSIYAEARDDEVDGSAVGRDELLF